MRAFISLGSNLGDREAILRNALRRLSSFPGIEIRAVSRIRETDPVGVIDQPRFLNAVAELETRLDPESLLDRLQEVEREFHRTRERRWGPRTLDLDLLLYGGRVMETARLLLPHPRLKERRFVLEPLAELAADLVVPGSGRTVGQLLREAVQ